MVLEQMGYRTAEEQLATILRAGTIGDLLMWDRVQHLEADTAQGALRYDSTPWRKAADFPLGTLFDGGIHTIAALTRVFGAPQTVTATGRTLRPNYGEYDQVKMFFTYANGSSGVLSHSACLPPVQNYFYVYGAAGAIVVESDRLMVRRMGQPDQVVELPAESAYEAMWRQIAQAHQEEREPAYSVAHALRDVAVLETVDQAIKTAARLPLMDRVIDIT
jgi:predicted dehydrogenase